MKVLKVISLMLCESKCGFTAQAVRRAPHLLVLHDVEQVRVRLLERLVHGECPLE